MKILIISPEKPYTGAESIVTGKLMKAMLDHGWDVKLVYHDTELIYRSISDTLLILKDCVGIKNRLISRFKEFAENPLLKKLLNFTDSMLWVIKALSITLKLNRKAKFDLIISRVMPRYGHMPALLFKFCSDNSVWIANWSDPLPKIKSPQPYGYGPEVKAGTLEMLYLKKVFKHADWHTFPSLRLLQYFKCFTPGFNDNCSVLPHIIFEQDYEALPYDTIGWPLKLTHVGGLGLRSPVKLIEAYKRLKETGDNKVKLKFRFVGFIEKEVYDLIDNYLLHEDFSFDGVKTYEETLDAIKSSDIMLVIEAPLKEGIFLPSKVVDYLQFDKPIFSISPSSGVMNDLITEFGGGLAADCTSVDDIAEKLIYLAENESLVKNRKDVFNTQKLKSQFSCKNIIDEIERIYHSQSLNN